MEVILGINAFHPDASACVLIDGQLKAAIAEERLGTRSKHMPGFPAEAVKTVLALAGISVRDVNWLAVGHDSNANLQRKALHVLANPLRAINPVKDHLKRRKNIQSLNEVLASACGYELDQCRFQVQPVEHHVAHVASSFFASPMDEAAAFSFDGAGDFVSGLYAHCKDTKIEVLDKVFLPSSLGYFYTSLCQFLGFMKFGEEYKVMGLSAYGKPSHMELMREILTISGSQYRLNSAFVQAIGNRGLEDSITEDHEIIVPPMYTDALVKRLGAPRNYGEEFSERDLDVSASMQLHFEDVVLKCLSWLHGKVRSKNLITAGGCALNGVCNARILRESSFNRSYIQCAASDDGTAIGAALYVWHHILGKPRGFVMDNASYGSSSTDEEIEVALTASGLHFERLDRDALVTRVAEYLNKGQVVGWFQGRSEWGPRALGNRSLLAHPGWPGMKDLINQKVKRREAFRPFAPSILAEAVHEYFEQDLESPFMMHVVKIRPEKRQELSAVCHEDSTGRLQTVTREQNALYYDLIKEFGRLSGTPVVLNTSFNENEPIVETPEQAIACYLRNDIDALAIGSYITSSAVNGKPTV